MQIYKIEKGIKVPKPAQTISDGKPSKVALTLKEMKKGDSFLITSELEGIKAEKVVRDRNMRERQGGGTKLFVTRRMDNGLRVFRTK